MPINNEFYLVFIAQQRLYNRSFHNDLYNVYLRPSFKAISKKLKDKFAANNDDKRIEELFRLWLILAPIVERINGVYRLNWSKSNYISYLAYTTSQLTKFYYLQEMPFEVKNIDELKASLEVLNIQDEKFTRKVIEIYKAFYNADNAIGKFTKTLYNKIFYAKFIQNQDTNNFKFLQRYDTILKLSKTPFAKSHNITKEITKVWDYQISRFITKNSKSKKREMKMTITLSGDTTKKFRENLEKCENEKQLIGVCKSFLERHKYIFQANNQFVALNAYLHKIPKIKTKYDIYQDYLVKSEVIKNLPPQVTARYLPSVFNEEYKNVDQNVFLNVYLNPYKEL